MISIACGKKKEKKKEAEWIHPVVVVLTNAWGRALRIELTWLVGNGALRHLFIYLPLKE